MDSALETIYARRSIRKYSDRPVTDEQVETVLRAAMAAPSAGNYKPVSYVVVRDPETRQALADLHTYAKMLVQAPVCIVPCGEPGKTFATQPEFWVQDASAATENLLLAAAALGLGAVWCGVYPVENRLGPASEVLGLPPGVIPFAFIAVGWPAETKAPRTQYEASRVHLERW